MFYGREKELALLREQFASSNKTAVLVYGKRRIGKTTLIAEAAKNFNGSVIFHLCAQSTFEGNLALLCRSVAQALGLPPFSIPTLFDLFDFLEAQNKPILLVLDEYQYLKDSARKGEVDSYLQSIIDGLSPQVKVVLCGSYITVMKELLDEGNPLFGRFTGFVFLTEMDYLDAQRFYADLPLHDKIALYAVFGGSPYVLSKLLPEEALESNIKKLLLPQDSLLRTHVESIMLAEVRKSFDVRILQALGNGRKRYSDIASMLGGDGAGLLDKQLKSLLGMETVEKEVPINRKSDKKKTFYSIKDNLMRFYFCYLFANEGLVARIGEDAFYDSVIRTSMRTFVSLRFEGIVSQFFSRQAREGKLEDVEDIGTYWYGDKETRSNGQFDCVIRRNGLYEFYEAKCYRGPMGIEECRDEEAQVRRAVGDAAALVGFVCAGGFDFDSEEYHLITGEDLYKREE